MTVKNKSFVDVSGLSDAFVGNQLSRLVDLIEMQGDDLLKSVGLTFPARASSTIFLISERGGVSTADIARELQQPHQLATQRVETLIGLGLLKRRNDPKDARRKILMLTAKGKKEAELLRASRGEAQRAFQDLYREIEVDLSAVALRTIEALNNNSLSVRIEAGKGGTRNGADCRGKTRRRTVNA